MTLERATKIVLCCDRMTLPEGVNGHKGKGKEYINK